MKNRYQLLAPGPVPVPERVLLAMGGPMIHHRTPGFEAIVGQAREGLKYVFQTQQEVLILASSGTGGMESAIVNTLSPGDKAITIDGGKFGERWANICKAYGIEPIVIKVEWGQAVDPAAVEKALKEHPEAKAVCVQGSETSTGVAHPVKALAELTKARDNTLLIVDGITSVGVMPQPMDEWGIDIIVTGSQKAMMLPPGLAFVSLSEKAWKMVETSKTPKFYFNLKRELKNIKENTTAWTPAVSLIIGLVEVCKMMQEEGLDNVHARHAKLAHAMREAFKSIGLPLFAPNAPASGVTAVMAPEGIDSGKVVKHLRDKYNITIAGGQDQAKGKIFRLAHMGYCDTFTTLSAISAVEMTLADLGYKFNAGQATATAVGLLKASA